MIVNIWGRDGFYKRIRCYDYAFKNELIVCYNSDITELVAIINLNNIYCMSVEKKDD